MVQITPTIRVNEKPYKWLQANRNKRFIDLYGGSSSSKSHTLAQYLIFEKAYKEKNIGILVVRKTRPSVKGSCWTLIHDWLDEAKLPYDDNKVELVIKIPNGNFIAFDGLDNIYKKKSIEGINYVWIEEAAGMRHDAMITQKEFILLDIICRSPNVNGINQLFMSYNPVDSVGNAWLKERTDGLSSDNADMAVMLLNHEDNPFLSKAGHRRIEALIEQDPEYNKIYRLGQWAVPTAIIYTRWDVVDKMTEHNGETYWGLDFGYSSNQAALVEIKIVGNEVWEQEWLYEVGLTNPMLIDRMRGIIGNRNQPIIADSAEPKSIQEIRNAGFNIFPCQKGADSVRFGINAVKSVFTHITSDSINLIEEKQTYKWKIDIADNVLQEPVKFKDHLMDAERYVLMKVKGKIKAGFVGTPVEEKEEIKPINREAMLAERYQVVEVGVSQEEVALATLDEGEEEDVWRE